MPEEHAKITDCYIFLLSKAYQKGHKLVQDRLAPYGLTNIQYVVLEVLWHEAGLTAVEIGKQLMIWTRPPSPASWIAWLKPVGY